MKLTEEQLVVLQDTLKEGVTYRETYEEVYDHLLTALEHSDNSLSLAKTLNNIMQNDFGGFKGLRSIERKRRWMVGKQMFAKLGHNLSLFLVSPLLAITCIVFCLAYYCVNVLEYQPYIMLVFGAAVTVGFVFKCVRYFKRRYVLKDDKKSIKDFPFFIISYYPFYILFIIKMLAAHFYKDEQLSNWFELHPLVQAFIYTFYIIYVVSFSKLYLEEFKRPDKNLLID